MDAGAIIVQKTIDVLPDDTIQTLSERIKTIEHLAYPTALNLLAEGKVVLTDGQCKWHL